MARPLRIEFHGALYHVTSRGDGQEAIYLDDEDRATCVRVMESVIKRFNWTVHAYSLMSNHYHLLVETPDANLTQGMRQFNGIYTQQAITGSGLVFCLSSAKAITGSGLVFCLSSAKVAVWPDHSE
jgi:REP element-mobilizing transposase RayT